MLVIIIIIMMMMMLVINNQVLRKIKIAVNSDVKN